MTRRVVVLGGGMVGSVMAADLCAPSGPGGREFAVTLADRDERALERARARVARRGGGRLDTVRADLSDPETIRRLASEHDLVCGALSSRLGFMALRAVCESGRPYADISFMQEDALELDELAKRHGARVIMDCGVAPGMSNLLVGYATRLCATTTRVEILVGGLPVERKKPFEYKAAFAPSDVIEEYTRPARRVENGRIVTGEALSEVELVDIPGLGTLEAFLTDGLRSLVSTIDAPSMVEKTMRYPGHAEMMRAFRAAGLFSKEPIEVGGARVTPLEVTSRAMFPAWTYEEGEEDLTAMRITVAGTRASDGALTQHRWTLLDRYSRAESATSMSRTTALPCTAVARILADDAWTEPGVFAPEALGRSPDLVARILGDLEARGITYDYEVTDL